MVPAKMGVLLSAWVREQHPALLQAMPMKDKTWSYLSAPKIQLIQPLLSSFLHIILFISCSPLSRDNSQAPRVDKEKREQGSGA